jgi:hypothetical protein
MSKKAKGTLIRLGKTTRSCEMLSYQSLPDPVVDGVKLESISKNWDHLVYVYFPSELFSGPLAAMSMSFHLMAILQRSTLETLKRCI